MVTISTTEEDKSINRNVQVNVYLTDKQYEELKEELSKYNNKFPNNQIDAINEYILLLLETLDRDL